MKHSKITSARVRKKQLEGIFSVRKKELEEIMGLLTEDFNDLSVKQLNNVIETFQCYKTNLETDRNEYVMIEGEVSNFAENLNKDYSKAIDKIKHYIDVKSDLGKK